VSYAESQQTPSRSRDAPVASQLGPEGWAAAVLFCRRLHAARMQTVNLQTQLHTHAHSYTHTRTHSYTQLHTATRTRTRTRTRTHQCGAVV
jgi:hypothetical protein